MTTDIYFHAFNTITTTRLQVSDCTGRFSLGLWFQPTRRQVSCIFNTNFRIGKKQKSIRILADEAVRLVALLILPDIFMSEAHTDTSLAPNPRPIRFSSGPVGERHFIFSVLYAVGPHKLRHGMSCCPHFDPVMFISIASTTQTFNCKHSTKLRSTEHAVPYKINRMFPVDFHHRPYNSVTHYLATL